jgi:hypothetical protein
VKGRILLFALVLAAGCAGPKSAPKAAKNEPPKEDERLQDPINIGPGEGTYRDETPERNPLWKVQWDESVVEPKDRGKAVLSEVRGEFFPEGEPGKAKPPVPFRGDFARVDQEQEILWLRGNVRVTSGDPKAALTCDSLRYERYNQKDPKARVIKATGNVRIVGPMGTIGPVTELWATSDLAVAATPEMFGRP